MYSTAVGAGARDAEGGGGGRSDTAVGGIGGLRAGAAGRQGPAGDSGAAGGGTSSLERWPSVLGVGSELRLTTGGTEAAAREGAKGLLGMGRVGLGPERPLGAGFVGDVAPWKEDSAPLRSGGVAGLRASRASKNSMAAWNVSWTTEQEVRMGSRLGQTIGKAMEDGGGGKA